MRRKTKTTNDSSSSSAAATFNAPAKKAANSGYPSGRYVPIAPRPTPITPSVIMPTTTAAANIQQIQKPIAPRKPAKIDPTDWWFDDDDQPPVVIVEPSSSTNHQRISHEHDRAAAAVAATTTTTADFGSDSQFRRYSLQRNDLSSEFANLAVRVHPARPMVNKSRRKRYQSPLRKTILKKQCNERLKCLQPQGYPAVSEAQPNVPYLAGVPPQLDYKSSSDHKFYRINNQQQQQPSIVDLQVSPCLPRKSIVYYGSHQAYHPVPQLSSSSSSIEQLPKLKNFKTASATLNPHKLDSTMMMRKMIPISTKRPPIAIVQPGPPGLHCCRQQPPPSSAKIGSDTKLLDLRPLEERRAGAKQPSAADSKVPIAVGPKQAITTNPAQQQPQQQQVDKPEHVIHQSSTPQLLPTDPFAVTLISGTTFVFDPRVFEHSVFGCRPSVATTNKKPIANPAAIDQQPTTPKDATRKSKKTAPLNDFFKVPIPSNLEIQLFNNQNPPECCSPATSSLTDQPVRRLKQPERVQRVLVSSLNKSRLDEVKDAILKRSVVWQNSEQIIRDEDPWEVEFVRRIINNPNQNQSGSKMMM